MACEKDRKKIHRQRTMHQPDQTQIWPRFWNYQTEFKHMYENGQP